MSYNSFISNPASGADSTYAQEPEVKGFSSSSSNLNTVENEEVEVFDIEDYKSDYCDENPAVFVCTYHKYNCGRSLDGAWLDITKFADYDEFMAVCRFLHRDEADPEFMFLDFENFCREWFSESGMSEEVFNNIQAYAELSADEREAFDAYLAYKGAGREDCVFDDFREAYCGQWKSEEEFAEQLAEDCDLLHGVPDNLRYYFDWSAYARDLFMCDFHFDSGHVFRCY